MTQEHKILTQDQLLEFNKIIDDDQYLSQELKNTPVIREVCLAGLWLSKELEKLNCPQLLIVRIQWTAGNLSFGRDAWEVHQQILQKYKNQELTFAEDFQEVKN